MYRNKPSKGFKSLFPAVSKSNENNGKNGISADTSVRSTKQILNLFNNDSLEDNKIEKNITDVNEVGKSFLENEKKNETEEILFYNVVYGKKTSKKHKTFSSDGILKISDKTVILKDLEGNILGKKHLNKELLEEGTEISIGSKIVQIIEKTVNNDSTNEEPPAKRYKLSSPSSSSSNYKTIVKKGTPLKMNENTLTMPFMNTTQNWLLGSVIKKEVEVTVDSCLTNVLREHQRCGLIFLYKCIMGMSVPDHFGAILADEMGLGKTLQCISLIWTLLKKGPFGIPILKRVLIVTPSSLCNNWSREFIHWLGRHRIFPYVADDKHKPKDFVRQKRTSVLIISYELFIRHYNYLNEMRFDLLLCDEGHRLKNNNLKAVKLLNEIECKRRILLSGTPIQNDLQEFYSLVNFVNPNILGTYAEYKSYYERPILRSQTPNANDDTLSLGNERAEELHEKTKSFILRRTHETINKYLPHKYEMVVFCRLSEEQEFLYKQVTNSWFKKEIFPDESVSHFIILTALKKICNHPVLFINDSCEFINTMSLSNNSVKYEKNVTEISKQYCGKISIVQTIMKNLKQTNEKLLLVSYYTKTLDLLEKICHKEGLRLFRLDGSTPSASRNKIIEQFNTMDKNNAVFLLSAKAGGVGLNLPGASRLILFDSDWNPASDAQVMARIWRDGQKNNVYIYRLLTTGTIEEKVYQRQISKINLSEIVVDSSNSNQIKFTNTELKDLFTLATDTLCLTHDSINCSCMGLKTVQKKIGNNLLLQKDNHQFKTDTDKNSTNVTINQLCEWQHYQKPIPQDVLKDIMLNEISENITFLFKNDIVYK